MTNTMVKINKKEEEIFNTVHVMDQPYDEVSRSFVVRCKDELELTWHLLHSSGNMHSNTYNQNLLYRLTRNHQVTLTHYELSVFLLTIFKSTSRPKAYPKWHSFPPTEYKMTCSNLISNMNFMLISRCAEYHVLTYESYKIHYLNLKWTTECMIVYNHHRKTTKIENG
ncbi:hypothetical protein HKD37_14G040723 [Glycine soja]